jgi:hypothetical protein
MFKNCNKALSFDTLFLCVYTEGVTPAAIRSVFVGCVV